jgi:hypothetical protein
MSVDSSGRRAAQALLQASERLGPPPDLARLRRRRRRRTAGQAGLVAVAAVLAVAVVWQGLPLAGRPEPAAGPGDSVAWPGVPDQDRHIRDAVPTGVPYDTEVAAGPDAVWVLNRNRPPKQDLLVRVDPATDRVVARILVGNTASHVAVGEGSVWVLRPDPRRVDLVQIDPRRNQVLRTLPVSGTDNPDGSLAQQLVLAGGSAWFVGQPGLVRVDLRSGVPTTVLSSSDRGPLGLLGVAGDSVWVTAPASLQRVRVSDNAVLEPTSLGSLGVISVEGLAAGAGTLVAFGYGLGVRVDPGTGRVLGSFPVGKLEQPVAGATDGATVVGRDQTSLYLLDLAGARVRIQVPLPGPGAVAVGAGAVWVTDEERGRLLRVDPDP